MSPTPDHVYLVCEPPGDPYYLCRIMEFLHVRSDDPTSPIDSLRVNWYYRPRDVQRFNNDSRLVYGTMHSDMCPITSLRGKCNIKHRAEIEDLDAFRKERDSFYFSQVFDRFIHRWYECIPVSQIINVPERVKKALDERWKFVVVEIGRVKELTSAVKTCKRCAKYCASNDSVDCAICKNSYHMNCVQPPLPKKPSRGFAWACGPCSRASERKLEARNTPSMSGNVTEAEEEETVEEEQPSGASNDTTRAPSPSGSDMAIDNHPATQAEIALAQMWPMRYLGIHCRVEDVLQYDDRAIYPRASSRLGPRHQANVTLWHGRPVELVKPADIKKRYNKGNATKKEGKLTKETLAAIEEEKAKRPKWVQDEPPGYVARGEDYANDDPKNTAQLIFKMPEESQPGWSKDVAQRERDVEAYVRRAKNLARGVGVPPFGSNFLDKALQIYTAENYNPDASLKRMQKIDRVKDLHEPVLTKNELIKFEEGVRKYGSEHRLIRQHMKTTMPLSNIIRFYYLWKKTPKGREIWGNFGGRKGSKRKLDDDGAAQIQQSVANDADDSAFDNEKAMRRGRGFMCKFCNTTHSRQWRKAPGVSAGQLAPDTKNGKENGKGLLLALCLRCAGLWRKYAIQWEDVDDLAKKAASGTGKAWKRKIDEELLRELQAANEAANMLPPPEQATAVLPSTEIGEPPKKKSKMETTIPPEQIKKKEKPPPPPKEPTPPPPPIIPTPPQWRDLPCAVCKAVGDTVSCDHCKLTVHARCFGLSENEGLRPDGERRWVCEQCSNDRNPTVSTDYACCLCLTEETLIDLVEPPRVSHKKKTDREREKERMEKELADAMRADYKSKQESLHRPYLPREPLKKTTGNNWVHVYCAVWTPEIRFSEARKLEVAEGFQQIPPARHDTICKLCKNRDHANRFRDDKGACVSCYQCGSNFHASCAFEAGYIFGFDVTPVKGSRKDQITTATLAGETGAITAAIWCKEHTIKTVVHPVNEVVDESGKTALQTYVETFKQADLTLTGTVRKANLAQLTKDKGQLGAQAANASNARRESGANSIAAAVRRGARNSIAGDAKLEGDETSVQLSDVKEASPERRCAKCRIDVTPRWHPVDGVAVAKEPTPPKSPPRRMSMTLGELADLDRERRDSQRAPEQPRQNIRFMPPGASGRAWDGMPDRYGSRAAGSGEPPRDQQANGMPSNGAHAETNGEGVFHEHALPQYQPSAGGNATPPTDGDAVFGQSEQQYLCHKCFLKRKLDPTPPPPERPAQSPARYTPHMDWQPQQTPQALFDTAQPLRMPQDEPARQSQPPAPPPPPQHAPAPAVNGIGMSYGQPHAPPPAPSYPPYGQHAQPNGYYNPPHAPPPHHQAPHPPPPPPPPHHAYTPPPMHERQPSYGYGAPPPTSNGPPPPPGPPYQQHAPPPPRPPLISYGPPGPPMPNGVPSPHVSQPMPMQSPTQIPPHFGGYGGPRRTESPFSTQLPPLGPERFNQSPSVTRPEYPPPQQHPGPPPPSAPQGHGQPPHHQPPGAQGSPHPGHMRPEDPSAGSPDGQGTPGLNGIGASASASVRNLLS